MTILRFQPFSITEWSVSLLAIFSILPTTLFANATFSSLYGVDLLNGAGMTVRGATGLLMVPTAQITPHGVLAGTYHNYVAQGSPTDAVAENYYLSAGVWRGFEVQLGLNELHAKDANPNAYGDFYHRDLVGNLKYSYTLSDQWRLAVGGQDVMGLAVKNQRFYGVMTHASRFAATTFGYAKKTASGGTGQNLSGFIGGMEVYLPYNVSALVDYDGSDTRGGVRTRIHDLFGTHLQLNMDAIVASTASKESISWGMSFSYPLGGDAKARLDDRAERMLANDLPDFQSHSTNGLPFTSANKPQVSHFESSTDKITPLDRSLNLKALKDLLMAAGLEHIALKVDEDTSILRLRYQNRLYDLNQFDGLAQAIAIVAPFANQSDLLNLEIEILNQQIPMMSVKLGTAWALGQLQKHHSKAAYYLPEFNRIEWTAEPTWQADVTGGRSEWLSLKMEPYIVSTIGSEIGVYQQSLGLLTELSAPLWQGASAHLSRIDPVYNSYHFRPGGFLDDQRVVSQWKELSLSQTWVPFDGLVNILSYQMGLNEGEKTDHFVNSTRYYFDEGRHQVYGNWSRHISDTPLATTGLNTWSGDYYGYEFYWPEKGMGAFIERGVYLNQDLTTKLGFKSYLGDSQLQATLLRTDTGYEKIRLSLTVPFTTKRAADLGFLTVRGENKWSYGIETIISDPDKTGVNLNLGDVRYVNFGQETKQPVILDQHFMDSGRLNPAYMRSHIHQLNQRVKRILYQQ